MDMSWIEIMLLTLFNATVCFFLPSIVTGQWSHLLELSSPIEEKTVVTSKVIEENIARS